MPTGPAPTTTVTASSRPAPAAPTIWEDGAYQMPTEPKIKKARSKKAPVPDAESARSSETGGEAEVSED